jgi:sarcosine oxidase subunit alpha
MNLRVQRPSHAPRVTIYVNGRPVSAYRGESVFAALHAAGYRLLRRSHRGGAARGAFCGMGLCQECRITVDGTPGRRACITPVRDHMEVFVDEP